MSLNPALDGVHLCPRCGAEAEVTPPRSLICPACGYKAYYNPTPAAGAVPELRRFPGAELPVLVATRMSLSFPGLLAAVPLWTVQDGKPVRHWVSDGGISSNFPVHLFDAWVPGRPTFGLNLVPARRVDTPPRSAEAGRYRRFSSVR